MSIDYNVLAQPKGKTRKQLKARKDRADAKQLAWFRDFVWLREALATSVVCWIDGEVAKCQHCGATVMRGKDVQMTGEVHHRISRRHKASRYDPDNGVLLCNHLVNNCHTRAEAGEITV